MRFGLCGIIEAIDLKNVDKFPKRRKSKAGSQQKIIGFKFFLTYTSLHLNGFIMFSRNIEKSCHKSVNELFNYNQ